MHSSSNKPSSVIGLAAATIMLMLAVLACTANDTLFIHLTETPVPTITPTPFVGANKFKIGDTAQIIGPSAFQQVGMAGVPGPYIPAQSPGLCLPGIAVKILDVATGQNASGEAAIYYQLSCSGGRSGWLAEYQLTAFLKNAPIVIASKDGTGATLYFQNDANGRTMPDKCPDGTKTLVSEVLSGKSPTDTNVYIQVDCNKVRAYVLETDVAVQ
ncbi:MAG: hypothetical protein KF726_20350 [Anaerolineae bacterium]|nr:hypothetical protein [Anaerolineae bacterium]